MPSRSTYLTIRITTQDKATLSKLCKQVHIYQSTYVNLLIQAELNHYKQTGVPSFGFQSQHNSPNSC